MVTVVDRLILDMDVKQKIFQSKMKQVEKSVKAVEKAEKEAAMARQQMFASFQKLFLGMGLAFLFTGMALKKFFQTMLTSLLQTFLVVEGETGPLNEQLNEVKAGLFSIAFQLVDAARQTGVFDIWISRLEAVLGFVERLSPKTKAWLVNALIWGTLAATAMMSLGMALLFTLGPLAALEVIGIANLLLWGAWIFAIAAVVILFVLLIKRAGGIKNAFKAMGIAVLKIIAAIGDFIFTWIMDPLRSVIVLINLAIRGFNALARTQFGRTLGLSPISEIPLPPKFTRFSEAVERKAENFRQSISVNVEGNVVTEDGLIETLIRKLNERLNFIGGSPQGG